MRHAGFTARAHLRPAWMLRAGLFLYDHLGKRQRLTGLKIIKALPRNPNGKILKRDLRASLFPERSQ